MTPDDDDLERLKAAAPEAAELLRQLANANRLLILCHIAQEERSVGQLEQELGLRQPGLSQQLAELRQSGLVKTRRESRSIYYSLADERAEAIMAMLHRIFCADPKALTEAVRQDQAPDQARPAGDAARFARIIPPR
ncbi:transcriptional regulator, ArsR family [Brevundimonas diminuta 3F5N]|uniref:Transcriptional regulator, ArsR family n=1 Tax=Brevundimonas diminuta 3F5N TaxID=1255603 RepID=A0A1R4G8E5_BREDI|nr:metalloregulator ArsR/SmtB family transcription factor [Brevundimonas diminuta]SJM64337.1 transcriptional regulator, ArsR family [Brevundimonas diminuta 3F5N]